MVRAVSFCRATAGDLHAIVDLLADGVLKAVREPGRVAGYEALGFEATHVGMKLVR